jgi:hypothetical protein
MKRNSPEHRITVCLRKAPVRISLLAIIERTGLDADTVRPILTSWVKAGKASEVSSLYKLLEPTLRLSLNISKQWENASNDCPRPNLY